VDLALEGRTAAVAAASTGLGFASAKALAAEGVTVAICGRDKARITEAAERIGPAAIPLVADVGSAEGGAAFIEAATEALGAGPDILVANCGGPPRGTFDSTDVDDFRAAPRTSPPWSRSCAVSKPTSSPARRSWSTAGPPSGCSERARTGVPLVGMARCGGRLVFR
jgi:short chain dehydrogenase